MARESYSFIDIAALDAVREHFAAGDAVVVLSLDLTRILWANGAGAELLGFSGVEAAIEADSGLGPAARRQIEATPGFPRIGEGRQIGVRLSTGTTSHTAALLGSFLKLGEDDAGIMLAMPFPNSSSRSPAEVAARAISGFEHAGSHLALLDDAGTPLAATPGFEAMGLPPESLSGLVAEAAEDGRRVVRKIETVDGRDIPMGLARLTRTPGRYLLIAVDESAFGEEAEAPHDDVISADAEDAFVAPDEQDESAGQDEPAGQAEPAGQVDSTGQDGPATEEPTLVEESPPAGEEVQPDAVASAPSPGQPPVAMTRDAAPIRFVWRTDAEGRFSAISPEFLDAVGGTENDIIGQRFGDVARRLGIDASGEIAALLDRRDTWSGRSVLWPVAGGEWLVPVDLAALPTYGRDRTFEGFRGFGVVRVADFVMRDDKASGHTEPSEEPAAELPGGHEDPFKGEPPVLLTAEKPARPFGRKVIRLDEHRAPAGDRTLSPLERSAFHEIGEQLRRSGGADPEAQLTEPLLTGATENSPGQDVSPAAPEGGAEPEAMEGPVVEAGLTDEATAAGPSTDHETAAEETDEAAADAFPAEPDPEDDAGREDMPATEAGGPAASAQEESTAETHDEPAAAHAEPPPIKKTGFLPSAFAEREEPRADTSILSQLPIPVLVHSGDALHYANAAFLDLSGYDSVEDLARHGGLDVLLSGPAADRGHGGNRMALTTRDGETVPVSAFLQSVPWLGGKALLLTLTRQPAMAPAPPADAPLEADLKKRVDELRTILDTATDGVVLMDKEGNVRSISRPAEALFGYDSETVVGKPFVSLFAIESQRAAADYLAGLAENGVASVLNDGREVIGREAQGRFIPLFMTIGRLPGDSGFCAVLRDITQWKRAEQDLTQARAQAERTSSQKSDFLARVSHEIRTPLNAIIGFSELMLDEKFGPVANDRYRDYLRDINRSGNHVLDLVNDLLDISKIEAGQQEMDYEAVALNDALAETVAMMQPQANRERVIIRSSFASKLPEVVADLRSVRQIALNILSNAVRYTQAGGQVIVSTSHEPSGEVLMRVRDTGIGMTQTEIEQALKPFKQLNALKRPRGDGTGLGLPLTKAMVEANRAKFAIYSTPGEGTMVEVTFPATRVLAG